MSSTKQQFQTWVALLGVARSQVTRAIASKDAGECGLAVVSIAITLEAYMNLHAHDLLPVHLHEPFARLSASEKYLLLPRLVGCSHQQCDSYEQDPLHERLKEITRLRNKIAHGNVKRWHPQTTPSEKVRELWNVGLDLIVRLEMTGVRVPPKRMGDFQEEVETLRLSDG